MTLLASPLGAADPVRRARGLWRRSLLLRVVTTSLALSLLAILVIGGYMSISIGSNLFDQRRDQVVVEAARAHDIAQEVFDDLRADSVTQSELDEAADEAVARALAATSNRGTTGWALLRTPDQELGALQAVDRSSIDFDRSLISPELAEAVRGEDDVPYWQSIRLFDEHGAAHPGILVATAVMVPAAGEYELYLVFDLADVQATLEFTQVSMIIGGLALLALVGLVTWIVVRMVVGPVEEAATAAEKIAAGELGERLPVRGDDVLGSLARSFNRMAESLRSQITRLAALSTVQQRFVSDVSHELRTPLTTIRLAGDVLYDQRESLDATGTRTVELLKTQISRFETLLADLLEMSRFDAGAEQLEKEPTKLVDLVAQQLEAVRPLADDRGSELVLETPGGHASIDVDPRRIRRILQNLLGNAIDHGEGGPIVVTVDSDHDAVAIAVRDHGVGMTEAESARVFDRFWRADPSRQRRTGGTGLGLAISQEDAALHGGWIDLWSAPGAGTMFRLTLPREGQMPLVSPIPLPTPRPEDAA